VAKVEPNQNAALYIRMSTDRQIYSPEHQRQRLLEHAGKLGLTVIAEYLDLGKSGLTIGRRPELRRLLADALSGNSRFTSVLVYDISRWGRFQDVDESAHYEYICRSSGVKVIYCAEQFADDTSPLAALLKSVKRSMAAEFSRELSSKVFAAQCRFITLGFKQGGTAGYGLRRAVIAEDSSISRVLQFGERKSVGPSRVVFVPGPAAEIAVLQQIYRWYVDERLGETAISDRLNQAGIESEFSRPWTPWLVHSILTNEKYLGALVFNRGSFKLQRAAVRNPPEAWIRRDAAFDALISQDMFQRAREERQRRARKLTEAELLTIVTNVFVANSKVTAQLLASASTSTLPKLLARKFGSLTAAYEAAGVGSSDQYRYVNTRRLIRSIGCAMVKRVLSLAVEAGGTAYESPGGGKVFFNDSLPVHVVVARSRHDPAGHVRWKINLPRWSEFVVVAQLGRNNQAVQSYYLLPVSDFDTPMLTIRGELPDEFARYRFASLAALFGVSE
jgi:DNA invertase Pin-like site-specific DNA recombinase